MSNNINYLDTDEVVESIKDLINLNERSMKNSEKELNKYKSKFATDDKFEACNHQHWKTVIMMQEAHISELKEILEDITDVRYEELQALQEAEEQDRDKRCSSYIGG